MALDSIVVHLDGKPAVEQRIHIAAQIAKSFRGRLKGIYTPSETDAAVDIAELSPSQLAHRIADRERRARGHSMLRRAAAAAGLAEEEVSCLATNVIEEIVAEMRCADLSVVTQPDFENDAGGFDRRLLENALLGVGGPVLIVPRASSTLDVGQNIVIAWDGGREAARAMRDALPMLASARRATLLSIGSRSHEGNELSQARAIGFLAMHGISAQARNVECTIDPAEAMLSQLADLGADLLVMGAYGHARLREIILGGMTRTILDKMTVPTFMSH